MAKSPSQQRRSRAAPKLLKLIEKYYADLKELAFQGVLYEGGTRPAFHSLLSDLGKQHRWTLIAEYSKKVNGRTVIPDGTFKDGMNLVRGYWEAKDTDDKLDVEIARKRKLGYPTSNIIFEDTATAVLFQHGQELLRVDMKDPAKLAELLTEFFRHVEPEIEEFEHAVDEFKQRVPDLAEGLRKKIEQAHKSNKPFQQAFDQFFELCRTSLNPNLSVAAVDEMLIQHILTERLIREIFDNPEFVRRNVIAAEVEKVMQAMTSQSFDRNTYLRELDRFYVAIEHAARTMTDFADKQHFLNTVYERFFQGYSVKLADTMGIVYTPQEIVDFMCASVAEVLENEFGKQLWSDDVYIIDPCTGTGNFIVNLIRRIPKAKLEDVYKHRLFANEIMLLPYYIAALNIEHAYFEQAGKYEGFEGLCFVDTLDLTDKQQIEMSFMTERNTERVERQKRSPITVIIGNPPYNAKQANENDNNKNRSYPVIEERIRQTFIRGSAATNKNSISDAYVKFFRWSVDRLSSDGILCFVTNNGFLNGVAFDAFRREMIRSFDIIYHFDLKGNARTSGERRRKEGGNVFSDQIRAGIGITLLARTTARKPCHLEYYAVADHRTADDKKAELASKKSVSGVTWQRLIPDDRGSWIVPAHASVFDKLLAIASKTSNECIFEMSTLGVVTARDDWMYDFDRARLGEKAELHIETYNAEVDRWARRKPSVTDVDAFVLYDDRRIKWSRDLKLDIKRGKHATFTAKRIRNAMYRGFQHRFIFYDDICNEETRAFGRLFPTPDAEAENAIICASGPGHELFRVAIAQTIVDYKYSNPSNGGTQCFPFYVYDKDGSNRRENITDWALKHFREHYGDKKIDKWAIFHYVYGVLHHPGYREKFADNLKRELPRIPLAPPISPGGTVEDSPGREAGEAGRKARAAPEGRKKSGGESPSHRKNSVAPPGLGDSGTHASPGSRPGLQSVAPPGLKRGGDSQGGQDSRTPQGRQEVRTPQGGQDAGTAQGGQDARTTQYGQDAHTTNSSGFWAFSEAGKALAALHLDYEKLEPWPLKSVETPGEPLSYRVDDKMRLNRDKTALAVNASLTLEKIPPEAFAYRLGNRSALEWVVDQYQVYTDPRSGITSDPNREDDPQYIVRLVGQVVRVSVETMKIVNSLPGEYA